MLYEYRACWRHCCSLRKLFQSLFIKTSGNCVKSDLLNYFSLWTIVDYELWWFDIIVVNKSDYSNHSNKDSDWLIARALWEYRACWRHCCSLRKQKFFGKLKVIGGEFNGCFNKYLLTNREALFCCKARKKPWRGGEKHPTTSRVPPYTSFVLRPLPSCVTTEQSRA